MARLTGKVKWYNPNKAFGFITPDVPKPDGTDIFVHVSGVESNSPLEEGQAVSFEIGQDRNGRDNAVNVKPV